MFCFGLFRTFVPISTLSSVGFVDEGRKNVSCPRAQGNLVTPLPLQTRVCYFFILLQLFIKSTVLVIKPFIDVEKEQTAPLLLFKLCTFCWWERKNIIAPGAGYPSYATDCDWLNARSGSFGSRPTVFKDTVERLRQWQIKRGVNGYIPRS